MTDKPILLVEDNEDDVFALKRAFRQEKIANPLFVVTDGQQALDYLSGTGKYADRESYPMPAIVFLDLKLPFVSGFDILAWIRHQPELGSLTVVVLTSSDETRDHEKARALGARSYIVKPSCPEDLRIFLQSIRNWIGRPANRPVVIKFSPSSSSRAAKVGKIPFPDSAR